jgi:hypothetical protein
VSTLFWPIETPEKIRIPRAAGRIRFHVFIARISPKVTQYSRRKQAQSDARNYKTISSPGSNRDPSYPQGNILPIGFSGDLQPDASTVRSPFFPSLQVRRVVRVDLSGQVHVTAAGGMVDLSLYFGRIQKPHPVLDTLVAALPVIVAGRLSSENCSETRVGASRKLCPKVDATIRERRPCTKLTGTQGLWFRSISSTGNT